MLMDYTYEELRLHAEAYIKAGWSPADYVHVLPYPGGLSTPITDGDDLRGYTATYYPLSFFLGAPSVVAAGTKGGSSKSAAKKAAVIANGKKGGRPKKQDLSATVHTPNGGRSVTVKVRSLTEAKIWAKEYGSQLEYLTVSDSDGNTVAEYKYVGKQLVKLPPQW